MKLLVDTQAFLYALREPSSLPAASQSALEDVGNELWLSVLSPIELQIKVNTGKLTLSQSVRDAVQREIDRGTRRVAGLAKQIVEVVVRADPCPLDRIAVALSDGPVLLVDPHGPDVVVAGQLLEPQ